MRVDFERIEVPMAVALGGAIGSVGRYGIALAVTGDGFPWATFVTNLLGCFALGAVLVIGEVIGHRQGRHHHRPLWIRLWRPFMATGVLGGFTTFSTFAVELNRVDTATSLLYLVSSLALGIAAYSAGNLLARRRFRVHA